MIRLLVEVVAIIFRTLGIDQLVVGTPVAGGIGNRHPAAA